MTYVVTFYSFKGGVGRTTLLVNVAHALADQGERVLIWDLDLEAPGVQYFPGLGSPEAIWQSGFLEWLGQTPRAPAGPLTAAWPDDAWLAKLGDRVYEAPGGGGALLVLPAHGTHVNLGHAYAQIDWHALFVDEPERGLHLFTRVRDALIARFRPSFLFLDARTGVSDLGGFLTGFLPDCTVLVGNYSRQSTAGLGMVYVALDHFAATEHSQAEPLRARKLERVLVASPVPTAPAEQERGRARWADAFPGVAPRSQIEVPLVENLLYAEDVLVRSAPSSDAARAYGRVAERVLELSGPRRRPVADDRGHQAFAARALRLLRLLGFDVTRDRTGRMIARGKASLQERVYTVILQAEDFTVPVAPPNDHPPLVILRTASESQRSALASTGATLRSIDELEDQLVDLDSYASTVRRGFEDSLLARGYVDLHAAGAGGALETALRWVGGEGPRVMFVTGEDGSGKTSFVRRLAYELVTRPGHPVPIAIALRQTQIGLSLDAILQQHLGDTIGWYGNPEAVRYLLARGRVVLLLDGLDEVGAQHLAVLTQPTEAAGETAKGNRVLITARSRPAEAGAATAIALAPFDDQQIARFLLNKLGVASAPRALAAVQANQSKKALATRPMMLALMSDDEALAIDSGDLTATQVCARYLDGWIRGGADRARLLYRLAGEIWQQPDHELPVATLARLLGREVRALDAELRTAPCLVRTEAGTYRFSHSLYLEYCVAQYLIEAALRGPDMLASVLGEARFSPGVLDMLRELVMAEPRRKASVDQALSDIGDDDAPEVYAQARSIESALRKRE